MIQVISDKTSTLSRRILQALIDRGMNQSDIAAMIQSDRSHVSRVRSGAHEFTDEQLEKIERSTQIPLGLLLLGAPPAPGAAPEVKRLHKEARELLQRSAAMRARL